MSKFWGSVYVNGKKHEALNKKDKTIEALMPLVEAMFPGINYYSISGFYQVMHECVIPVFKKRFPELLSVQAEKITPRAMTEIAVVLPSKGYEWQDSSEWRTKFEKLLATT